MEREKDSGRDWVRHTHPEWNKRRERPCGVFAYYSGERVINREGKRERVSKENRDGGRKGRERDKKEHERSRKRKV